MQPTVAALCGAKAKSKLIRLYDGDGLYVEIIPSAKRKTDKREKLARIHISFEAVVREWCKT